MAQKTHHRTEIVLDFSSVKPNGVEHGGDQRKPRSFQLTKSASFAGMINFECFLSFTDVSCPAVNCVYVG